MKTNNSNFTMVPVEAASSTSKSSTAAKAGAFKENFMTFKFKHESHVLKHPAQYQAVFPLELNVELDLVTHSGKDVVVDFVHIRSEVGDLYLLTGLPLQDQAEISEIIEDYRSQYSDYLCDMAAGAADVRAEISTDEAE